MNYLLIAVCACSIPSSLGFNVKVSPAKTVELNNNGLRFKSRHAQTLFFNNVFGYDIEYKGDNLFVTSGVLQTAWACGLSAGANFKAKDDCTNIVKQSSKINLREQFESYGGVNHEDLLDLAEQESWTDFNNLLDGSISSWSYNVSKIGFGWGRSLAVKNADVDSPVSIGCPGCTGQALDAAAEGNSGKHLRQAGLVYTVNARGFDLDNADKNTGSNVDNLIRVRDASYRGENGKYDAFSFYGNFPQSGAGSKQLLTSRHVDVNCQYEGSACSFGAAVVYDSEDKLIVSRSRSARNIGRSPWVDRTCRSDTRPYGNSYSVGAAYCNDRRGIYQAVGDALDVTDMKTQYAQTSVEADLTGSKLFVLKDWGISDNFGFSTADFKNIANPSQTPAYSRVGQSMVAASFGLAMGAPAYGDSGAVLIYTKSNGNYETKDVSATGLRYESAEAAQYILPEGTGASASATMKANFGASLHYIEDGNDGYLVVGAPTDIPSNGIGQGTAFVYKYISAKSEFEFHVRLTPSPKFRTSASARFGTSVTSSNLDGSTDTINDIIIGAPFNTDGCPLKGTFSTGYCGAVYVFSGKDIADAPPGTTLFPNQRIVGADHYSMLGQSVVDGPRSTSFFASAPGGFTTAGSNFDTQVLCGYDCGGASAVTVKSKVFQYDTKQFQTLTTVFNGAFRESDNKRIVSQSGTLVVPAADAENGFKLIFDLTETGDAQGFSLDGASGKHIVEAEIPQIYKSDEEFITTTTVIQNTLVISIKLIKTNTNRVLQPRVFSTRLTANGDVATTINSVLTSQISVGIGELTDSDASIDLAFQDPAGGTEFKIGEWIRMNVKVTNQLDTTDDFLSIEIILDKTQAQSIRYDTILWQTATTQVNNGVPQTKISRSISVEGSTTDTFPFEFIITEALTGFTLERNIKATLAGSGNDNLDNAEKSFTIDDNCSPSVVSLPFYPGGDTAVLQGGTFTLQTVVGAALGRRFRPSVKITLPQNLTLAKADNFCSGVRNSNGISEISCSRTSIMAYDSPDVIFENVIQVANIFGTGDGTLQVADRVVKTADESGCTIDSTDVDVVIRSSTVTFEAGSKEVPLWAIGLAIGGAILLGLLIALLLWKLGFFKRKKPPTDGAETGELDEEVQAGSMLRG